MQGDTLFTTQEDEVLSNKLRRTLQFCRARDSGSAINCGGSTEATTLEFKFCIKESPFSKYGDLDLKGQRQNRNNSPIRKICRKLPAYPGEISEGHSNSIENSTIGSAPKCLCLESAKSQKSWRTYPKSILKSGTNSKYSKNFKKYFDYDQLQSKAYDDDDEDDEEFDSDLPIVRIISSPQGKSKKPPPSFNSSLNEIQFLESLPQDKCSL